MPKFTRSRRTLRNGIVVVFAFCTLLYVRKAQPIQAAAHAPFGPYTAQQILERTIPLCQELLPFTDVVQFTVEPRSQDADDGRVCHFWEVDCINGKHADLAYFWWDAQTGTLTQFALCSPLAVAHLPLPLTREAAVGQARYWMEKLGWGLGREWQVCLSPRLAADAWIIELGKQGRRIRTRIDAGNGLLVSVMDRSGVTTFKGTAH